MISVVDDDTRYLVRPFLRHRTLIRRLPVHRNKRLTRLLLESVLLVAIVVAASVAAEIGTSTEYFEPILGAVIPVQFVIVRLEIVYEERVE